MHSQTLWATAIILNLSFDGFGVAGCAQPNHTYIPNCTCMHHTDKVISIVFDSFVRSFVFSFRKVIITRRADWSTENGMNGKHCAKIMAMQQTDIEWWTLDWYWIDFRSQRQIESTEWVRYKSSCPFKNQFRLFLCCRRTKRRLPTLSHSPLIRLRSATRTHTQITIFEESEPVKWWRII